MLRKEKNIDKMSKEKIIQVLESSNEPLKSAAIAELSGIDKKEVGKIIKKLKVDGLIESPKNCFYQIKK